MKPLATLIGDLFGGPWSLVGRKVQAKRTIEDSPLATLDATARKGQCGEVVDYDDTGKVFYVDFGNGAIICDPSEIKPL